MNYFCLTKSIQISIASQKKLFHFFKVIELTVTKTFWTVSFITVNAEIAVFVTSNYVFTSETFA